MSNLITLKDVQMNEIYINCNSIISFSLINDATDNVANTKIIFSDSSTKSFIESVDEVVSKIEAVKL